MSDTEAEASPIWGEESDSAVVQKVKGSAKKKAAAPASKDRFRCSKCRKQCHNNYGLKYHETNVCKVGGPSPGDAEAATIFRCETCGKTFKSKPGLAYHAKQKVCSANSVRRTVEQTETDKLAAMSVDRDMDPELLVGIAMARQQVAGPAAETPEDAAKIAHALSLFKTFKKGAGQVSCPFCGVQQGFQHGLQYHLNNRVCRGGVVDKILCPFCSKQFASKIGILSHIRGRLCEDVVDVSDASDSSGGKIHRRKRDGSKQSRFYQISVPQAVKRDDEADRMALSDAVAEFLRPFTPSRSFASASAIPEDITCASLAMLSDTAQRTSESASATTNQSRADEEGAELQGTSIFKDALKQYSVAGIPPNEVSHGMSFQLGGPVHALDVVSWMQERDAHFCVAASSQQSGNFFHDFTSACNGHAKMVLTYFLRRHDAKALEHMQSRSITFEGAAVVDAKWCPHFTACNRYLGLLAVATFDNRVRLFAIPQVYPSAHGQMLPVAILETAGAAPTCLEWNSCATVPTLFVGCARGEVLRFELEGKGFFSKHAPAGEIDRLDLGVISLADMIEAGIRDVDVVKISPKLVYVQPDSVTASTTLSQVRAISFAGSLGRVIMVGHRDGLLRVWAAEDAMYPLLEDRLYTGGITGVSYSESLHQIIASTSDGQVIGVDTHTGHSSNITRVGVDFPAVSINKLQVAGNAECQMILAACSDGCVLLKPLLRNTSRLANGKTGATASHDEVGVPLSQGRLDTRVQSCMLLPPAIGMGGSIVSKGLPMDALLLPSQTNVVWTPLSSSLIGLVVHAGVDGCVRLRCIDASELFKTKFRVEAAKLAEMEKARWVKAPSAVPDLSAAPSYASSSDARRLFKRGLDGAATRPTSSSKRPRTDRQRRVRRARQSDGSEDEAYSGSSDASDEEASFNFSESDTSSGSEDSTRGGAAGNGPEDAAGRHSIQLLALLDESISQDAV